MDVRNCRGCRRLFNYVTGPVMCPACREELEKKFQQVKEYVKDHPGITVTELSDACGVEINQIKQWLRDERLEMTSDTTMFLCCESCGVSIRTGRYCEKCKTQMANGFRSILEENKAKKEPSKEETSGRGAKMRYF